jgi:hypothetical protein
MPMSSPDPSDDHTCMRSTRLPPPTTPAFYHRCAWRMRSSTTGHACTTYSGQHMQDNMHCSHAPLPLLAKSHACTHVQTPTPNSSCTPPPQKQQVCLEDEKQYYQRRNALTIIVKLINADKEKTAPPVSHVVTDTTSLAGCVPSDAGFSCSVAACVALVTPSSYLLLLSRVGCVHGVHWGGRVSVACDGHCQIDGMGEAWTQMSWRHVRITHPKAI